MKQDVINDCYARLYEIPFQLAKLGHQVDCLCLSYRLNSQGKLKTGAGITWTSVNALSWLGIRYLVSFVTIISKNKPKIIFTSSDAPHIILGWLVSKILKIKHVCDLYDNYEIFALSKLPFVLFFYRKALQQADLVLTVSDTLKTKIMNESNPPNIHTIVSTIDPALFYSCDPVESRQTLGLANDNFYFGLTGSLSRNRGVHYVYDAFIQLHYLYPNSKLILAGDIESGCEPPAHPAIMSIGKLPHHAMNRFYNAMDVNIIAMIDSEFGRYAFPQKAYEIAAAKKPLIAPDLGAMGQLFANYPQILYQPENTQSLLNTMIMQIKNPIAPDIPIPTWAHQANIIHKQLHALTQ